MSADERRDEEHPHVAERRAPGEQRYGNECAATGPRSGEAELEQQRSIQAFDLIEFQGAHEVTESPVVD